MAETKDSKLKINVIMTTLEVGTQELADEIGEQRTVISGIISNTRKAGRARRKMADALSKRMIELIVPSEPTEAEKAA